MLFFLRCTAAFLALTAPAAALVPTFHLQFLGSANHIDAMNESGVVVGWVSSGATRGFVAGPGHPWQLLPLPAGMNSSFASDINDDGVIVGAAGPSSSPEYYLGGRAVSWTPDGAGGYTVTFLGQLPGHLSGLATAINNSGDIVGFSSNGMFRYPVLFTPGGPTDLSPTGLFDPSDVNDERVVVDHSFTARKLDLDTMIVEDLGVPPGSYRSTRAEAINDAGVVVGAAVLATSTNCDHQAARHDGSGWDVMSICGQSNSAYDVNAAGDVIMQLNVAVWVELAGFGAHRVEDLITPEVGHWYVINSYGNALNDARQLAVLAHNPTTGQAGAVLLTPDAEATVAETRPMAGGPRLAAQPSPFRDRTMLRFELSRAGRAVLVLHDVTGRRIAVLADRAFEAGASAVVWDGRDFAGREVPAGIYFARLDAGAGTARSKVVKLR
jgi:uncharacterized membrane protein